MSCPVPEYELAKNTSGSAASHQEIRIASSLCVYTEMYSGFNGLVTTEGASVLSWVDGVCICEEGCDWCRAAV